MDFESQIKKMMFPTEYITANETQRSNIQTVIDELSDIVIEMKGCCIDIGAGPGDATNDIVLPKLHPSATVVCSDISEDMVEFGRKKYANNDRLTFVQLDIETSNLPRDLVGKFNHALSFHCLHWCRDSRRVLENIWDLLKPGGTSLCVFPNKRRFANAYEALAIQSKYQPYMDLRNSVGYYQNSYGSCEIFKALLQDIGFEIGSCSLKEQTWHFDVATLETFLMVFDQFLHLMPAELQLDYKKDLLREVIKPTTRSQNNNDATGDTEIVHTTTYIVAYFKKPIEKMMCPMKYITANETQRSNIQTVLDELSDIMIEMKGCCIDIGAGPGDATNDIILPKLHPSATVVCSDISKDMVEFGKTKYANNDRLNFVQLNIETSNLPRDLVGKFNHALSFHCLHWCRDLRRVLGNIWNLLKPGGTSLCVFPNKRRFANAYATLAVHPKYQPYMDLRKSVGFHQHSYGSCEIFEALLQDVGFDISSCSLQERTWHLSVQYLKTSLLAFDQFLHRMPAELQSDYKKDLLNEVMKQTTRSHDNNNVTGDTEIVHKTTYIVAYFKKPVSYNDKNLTRGY